MFLPTTLDAGQLLLPIATVVPFLLIYLWHMKHARRQKDALLGKIEAKNRILTDMFENQKKF